jgi:hypothetical protein
LPPLQPFWASQHQGGSNVEWVAIVERNPGCTDGLHGGGGHGGILSMTRATCDHDHRAGPDTEVVQPVGQTVAS